MCSGASVEAILRVNQLAYHLVGPAYMSRHVQKFTSYTSPFSEADLCFSAKLKSPRFRYLGRVWLPPVKFVNFLKIHFFTFEVLNID